MAHTLIHTHSCTHTQTHRPSHAVHKLYYRHTVMYCKFTHTYLITASQCESGMCTFFSVSAYGTKQLQAISSYNQAFNNYGGHTHNLHMHTHTPTHTLIAFNTTSIALCWNSVCVYVFISIPLSLSLPIPLPCSFSLYPIRLSLRPFLFLYQFLSPSARKSVV